MLRLPNVADFQSQVNADQRPDEKSPRISESFQSTQYQQLCIQILRLTHGNLQIDLVIYFIKIAVTVHLVNFRDTQTPFEELLPYGKRLSPHRTLQ